MVLKISAKCSDLFSADLVDGNKTIREYEGSVPEFFPDDGGDYVALDIDMDTGKILNWVPPTKEQLEDFINESKKVSGSGDDYEFDDDDKNLDLSDL